MCTAIISDIYANLEILGVVNRGDIKCRVDAYICLGDVVGFFDGPQLYLHHNRATAETILLANHDEAVAGMLRGESFNQFVCEAALWTADQLTTVEREFLGVLPLMLERDGTFLVYSQPHDPRA